MAEEVDQVSGTRVPVLRRVRRRRRANVAGGSARSHAHLVRVNVEEEAQLLGRAEAQGVSVPRLLVEAALADESSGLTRTQRSELVTELFALQNLLARAGVNLNQLAKVANSTGEMPTLEQVQGSHRMLFGAVKRIDAALDVLPGRPR